MDFTFTEEQLAIRQAARDFAKYECLPGVIERDEKQQLPREQLIKLADLGFMGMMISPEFGGAGMDTVSYVLAMEEISKIDASVSVAMSVNNSLVCWGLEFFGSFFQKDKWLRHLAAGKKDGELYIGAFLLSEPEAGSDATSQKTFAVDKGDHYILNGMKNWITNGNSASVYLVMAQTHAGKGSKGINAFIVEKNTTGILVGPKENKLGIRGSDQVEESESLLRLWGLLQVLMNWLLNMQKRENLLVQKLKITRSYNLSWRIWQPGSRLPVCFV
jgi:alkylation response protein AidB-like acyl-CoA dehydrogenase